MGLPNPFQAAKDAADALEKARDLLELAQQLQKQDSDGDGTPDLKEYLEDTGAIMEDVELIKAAGGRIQKRIDAITERFGDNVDLVKEKLGVE